MCTAITYQTNHHYFGRNLDLEYSYRETVTVTPRNYPFTFRSGTRWEQHYAMIGMAYVQEGYPLYYEATNEKGLSAAGLNFPGNAVYHPYAEGKHNVAPFELIPWLLGQCATLQEARALQSLAGKLFGAAAIISAALDGGRQKRCAGGGIHGGRIAYPR